MQIAAPLRQGHLYLVHIAIAPGETGFHLRSLGPCFEETWCFRPRVSRCVDPRTNPEAYS